MTRYFRTLAAAILLAGMGAFTLTGCDFTQGFDEDPNAALTAPPRLLLAGGQVGIIQLMEGDYARIATMWSGQGVGGERQYARIQTGGVNQEDFNNTWIVGYHEALRQLQLAAEGFEEQNNPLGVGIARVNMAMAFGTLTSLFGDIPFSQALDPFELNPQFDDQLSVYAGIQGMLDDAIANLNATTTNVQQNEIFGLNRQQYIRVAHTLKARYYLHVGNYAGARAAAEQGIANPEGSLIAPHFGNANADANLFWAFIARERSGYLLAENAFAVQLLSGERDNNGTDESARRDFYYMGETEAAVFNTEAGGAFAANAGFPLVSYEENQLILAEAALLADGGSAAAQDVAVNALNAVRGANRARFGDDSYDDYDTNDFDTADDLLREVLTEKYLSLIGQIEAFNDIRRTRNYIGAPAISGTFPEGIPQRFLYPQNEANANANFPGVVPTGQRTAANAQVNYQGL